MLRMWLWWSVWDSGFRCSSFIITLSLTRAEKDQKNVWSFSSNSSLSYLANVWKKYVWKSMMIVWWWSGKTAGIWNAAEFCNFANLINTSAADVEKDGFLVSGWPYGGRLMASRVFAVGYFPYLMTDLIFLFFLFAFIAFQQFSLVLGALLATTTVICYSVSVVCVVLLCVCFKAPSPFPLPKWKWISTSTAAAAAAVGNCKIQIALECIIIIELQQDALSLLFSAGR